MNQFSKNRRQLLKRVVSTSLALPFLGSLPSFGAGEIARKRLIIMFSPNGTIPDEHFPSGGETNFNLKRILSPLESIRDQLLIYKGLENKIPKPGDGHQRGMGGLWTASKLTPGSTTGGDNDGVGVAWAGGPSVDQVVANKIGGETRFRSLEYGVEIGGSNIWKRMVYADRNKPLQPEENPYTAFKRLYDNFDNTNVGPTPATPRLASVLDGVLEDFSRARPYLSQEDRAKLESHAQSVREIESGLQQPGPSGMCVLPDMGKPINVGADDNMPAIGKLFMDLMVSSFACDQTAVASMQWTRSVSGYKHKHIGVNGSHHSMSHDADSANSSRENLIKINNWYAKQFLYLVQKLQATPDPSGSGTLMDNTLVVWGNELGKGNSHTRRDIPFVSAGSCQGYFRTGRYINRSGQVNHSRFLTSITKAFGVERNGFGDYNEGSLDGELR